MLLHGLTIMRKVMAVLLGAMAFQIATALVEARSSEIGDVVRLLLLGCAIRFFISALPGARCNPGRTSHNRDERFSGFDRRVVTLTLRGPGKPSGAISASAQ